MAAMLRSVAVIARAARHTFAGWSAGEWRAGQPCDDAPHRPQGAVGCTSITCTDLEEGWLDNINIL
jgi:hypothetical protein